MAQGDDEEMAFFFGVKKKRKKKMMHADLDTLDATDQLADRFSEDLAMAGRRAAVRAECSRSGVGSSACSCSSCSSRSSSSSSGSSSRSVSSATREESDISKQGDTVPLQRCMHDVQATSDTPPLQRCEYAARVQSWSDRVPIGFGLCPWAGTARSRGCLRYVTCDGDVPVDVATCMLKEAELLTSVDVAPLSTTLIVCPHVTAWKDFNVFDDWVRSGSNERFQEGILGEAITLVAFHPEFLRWYGLPEDVEVGSVVQSHWVGMAGSKSADTLSATILETRSPIFGMHKLKVRFHGDIGEQYVPIDWFADSAGGARAPLPENAMHRAPHPTVHLIRNEDLKTLCIRDISRVKRQNATRMMKLGWEGVERRLRVKEKHGAEDVTMSAR